jgi:hypothetical protein
VAGGFDRVDTPIVRVNGPNQAAFFKDGLPTNVGLLFAQGAYGSGMFISEPLDGTIKRLLPNGTLTTFASNLAGPFQMTYFQGSLLVADGIGSNGHLLRIDPDGSSHTFASTPLPPVAPDVFSCMKSVMTLSPALAGQFGGPILAGNFDDGLGLTQDTIYVVSADGKTVTPIVTPVQKPSSLTEGPGGAFGSDVFVSQKGISNQNETGHVSILKPDGTLTPFMSGIDAADVVFDTKGILGGGMFISDSNGSSTGALSGRIWRVTATPEPSTFTLLVIGTLGLLGYARRRKQASA